MTTLLFLMALVSQTAHDALASASTVWSQPPVGCVEEMIQQESPWPCPDFTDVKDPTRGFPASMTPEEITLWSTERSKALLYCRAHEIMRRETAHPGTFDEGTTARAWMRLEGAAQSEAKADAIYEASASFEVPPQILVGALMQESLMADLGISEDGGNFSCGIAQLNVQEWCNWAHKQPTSLQNEMGWPVTEARKWSEAHGGRSVCDSALITPALVRPFYKIGLSRLRGLPSYRLAPEHLSEITLTDVSTAFPPGSGAEQKLRFGIVRAFTQNCSQFARAIPAKANQLRILFENDVPPALRNVQQYSGADTYHRSCRQPYPSKAYPLHPGWLLADAIYNAGSKIVSDLAFYLRLTPRSFASEATWSDFHGPDLISALYWGGKYNPKTDWLEFRNFSGRTDRITFFKACIVQRHIARVIQYVTLPGHELARSLEDKNGCRKSEFDANGKLIRSWVPLERRRSSGRL